MEFLSTPLSRVRARWESSARGDEWIHKTSPSRLDDLDRIYNYIYEMTRLFRVISWGRTTSTGRRRRETQRSPSFSLRTCERGKKNIGNKREACRSVKCIGHREFYYSSVLYVIMQIFMAFCITSRYMERKEMVVGAL